MSPPAVSGCLLLNKEADPPRFGLRRGHELANRLKHYLELSVIFLFQRIELASELGVRGKELPQSHTSPHNLDIDLHGPLAIKNAG